MSNLPPPPAPPGAQNAKDAAKEAKADARAARARAKALRPWYRKKRWWLLAAVVVIVGIAVAPGGGDDGGTAVGAGSPDAPAGDPETRTSGGQDVYALGQTAHTGDFDVTLHAVEDPFVSTNQFDRPSEGNRFVAVELTVTNTSDEQRTLSTLLGAEVTDSLSRPWDVALAGFDLPQLDGTVPAGESRRGWIVFELPDDATDLRLRIKGNLTATGSLFALS